MHLRCIVELLQGLAQVSTIPCEARCVLSTLCGQILQVHVGYSPVAAQQYHCSVSKPVGTRGAIWRPWPVHASGCLCYAWVRRNGFCVMRGQVSARGPLPPTHTHPRFERSSNRGASHGNEGHTCLLGLLWQFCCSMVHMVLTRVCLVWRAFCRCLCMVCMHVSAACQ